MVPFQRVPLGLHRDGRQRGPVPPWLPGGHPVHPRSPGDGRRSAPAPRPPPLGDRLHAVLAPE